MAVLLRLLERPLDQLTSDSALPERRLHGEWPEQEGGRAADADAREPDGADQQRSDPGRKRQFEPVRDGFPQPVGGAGITPRTKGALVQTIDRQRVVGAFVQYGEGEI